MAPLRAGAGAADTVAPVFGVVVAVAIVAAVRGTLTLGAGCGGAAPACVVDPPYCDGRGGGGKEAESTERLEVRGGAWRRTGQLPTRQVAAQGNCTTKKTTDDS